MPPIRGLDRTHTHVQKFPEIGISRVLSSSNRPTLTTSLQFYGLTETFSNVSAGSREFLARYQKIVREVTEASRHNKPLPDFRSITGLPREFLTLIGAASYDNLERDDVKIGITKYRTALQTAMSEVPEWAKKDNEDRHHREDQINKDIETLSNEVQQTLATMNTQFNELERSIAESAKGLYSDKVGGSSFLYLLIVFAGVFAVIMISPKLYGETIAANILKAEFLLQFSTVFVLVAAIIILGIGELIDKQQLPVLLAGISGYVLGQLRAGSQTGNAVESR